MLSFITGVDDVEASIGFVVSKKFVATGMSGSFSTRDRFGEKPRIDCIVATYTAVVSFPKS